jgi:nucleoside-diphosphate-sugar epimerase
METTRALVTGGVGLIGYSIVKNLLKHGEDVIVADDLSVYDQKLGEKLRAQVEKEAKFYKLDFSDPSSADALKPERPDFIYNFGSYSSDRYYEKDERGAILKTILKTVMGQINAFKIAGELGAKVVYPSSGTVYGNTPAPQTEGQKLAPQTVYAATKAYLEMYSSVHGQVRSTALRIFTGFGAKELYKGSVASVVTLFTAAAIRGEELVVYGDGTQKRDFIEVDDVAEVAYRAAKSEKDARVLNCGSGKSYSYLELIDLIRKHAKDDLKVVHVPSRTKFVAETRADVALLRDATGYVPKGLVETYPKYLRELKELLSNDAS